MASGRVNRIQRPNTWLHRPACNVKKVLANSEPSTHLYQSDRAKAQRRCGVARERV